MNPWPMRFPDQPCLRCGQPVDISDSIAEFEPEGRLLGFRHEECPQDDS